MCQNSLDPDWDRHFVGPDLGPYCLQKLSADDTRKELIGKVKVLKFLTLSAFCFQIKCMLSGLEFTKSLIRLLLQKQSDLGLCFLAAK